MSEGILRDQEAGTSPKRDDTIPTHMPVRVVLNHPRGFFFRRLWQRVATLVGAVILVVGIAASIVAVPSTFLTVAWFMDENVDIELGNGRMLSADEILLAAGVSIPLAFFGVSRGLRLVRGGRTLVLFLRRFGYDDATSAVTFAVTRTIGRSWRLVTLDDLEIAPLGVPTGTKWLFRAVRVTGAAIKGAVDLLLRVFPTAQLGLWVIVGLDLVRVRIWERAQSVQAWTAVLDPYFQIIATTFDGRLPIDEVGLHLPGAFALLAVVLAGMVIGLGAALTAAPLAWAVGAVLLFFFSFPADAVHEAELSKTREIRSAGDIGVAAAAVTEKSRRVFGPRLVVLRVASDVWRQTVSRFATESSVSLVDVSEPTGNLIWEIEELTVRRRTRCVFICQHDRALEIAASGSAPDSRPLDADVARLLELEEILAYTTDRRGQRRFARALRSALLSMSA
jgi:hypothetical protein